VLGSANLDPFDFGDKLSLFHHRWPEFDEIWQTDSDYEDIVEIETGSRIPMWRMLVF